MVLKIGHLEGSSEDLWKFWNMVLEWGGKDKLDRSCEKWRSITYSHGGKEFVAYNKT